MKSLMESLQDSLKINESKEKMLRFDFSDLDKADETIKSIEDLGQKNGIYTEKIDGGIKIKATDSNRDKLESIQDVLQEYVQGMQDNDKADQEKVEALGKQIEKFNKFIDEEDDEDDNEGE